MTSCTSNTGASARSVAPTIDIALQGYGGSFLGVTNERNLLGMGDDNVRFVILLIMGVVVAVAVFSYFLFMSEIHIG